MKRETRISVEGLPIRSLEILGLSVGRNATGAEDNEGEK